MCIFNSQRVYISYWLALLIWNTNIVYDVQKICTYIEQNAIYSIQHVESSCKIILNLIADTFKIKLKNYIRHLFKS